MAVPASEHNLKVPGTLNYARRMESSDIVKTAALAGVGTVVAAAVAKELRKPAGERTWHVEVAGFVPYDFRPPTLRRARDRWWNPRDPRLLTPRVFGVGWELNLARLVRARG
jgi:hypothetical protein